VNNPLDHPHASQAYKVTLFTQQELMRMLGDYALYLHFQ
jgi:hypothetical protein